MCVGMCVYSTDTRVCHFGNHLYLQGSSSCSDVCPSLILALTQLGAYCVSLAGPELPVGPG